MFKANAPRSYATGTDPKQLAFDALQALLSSSTAAASNPANTKEARDAAFDLRATVADQVEALDVAVFNGNTIQLQAAASTLNPGMEQLKALEVRIKKIGNDMKELASITTQIDSALEKLAALL